MEEIATKSIAMMANVLITTEVYITTNIKDAAIFQTASVSIFSFTLYHVKLGGIFGVFGFEDQFPCALFSGVEKIEELFSHPLLR